MATLKDIFVPSERNGMLPFALHTGAFVLYLVIALFATVTPAYLRHLELADLSAAPQGFTPSDVIKLVNASREAVGLPDLVHNPTLDAAAEAKAKDIFANQYFAHVSPANVTPWDLLRRVNYIYSAAGENLALDFTTPESAHESLMESPTHRANILNRLYDEIGVAVIQGTYENHPSIVVVQYFGKPRAIASQEKPGVAGSTPKTGTITAAPKPQVTPTMAEKPKVSAPAPAVTEEKKPEAPAKIAGALNIEKIDPAFAAAAPAVRSLEARITQAICPCERYAAMGGMLLILLSLVFLVTRGAGVPIHVAFKAILFLVIFGHIVISAPKLFTPKLTEFSVSDIVAEF
jgi:uncharacterized protein YkwD